MKKWKKLKNNPFLYLCRLQEDGMSLWTKIRGSWFFVRQEFCVFPLTKTFYGIFNCLSIWSTFSSTSTVTGCNTNCRYSYLSGGIKAAMLMRQKRVANQRSASQVDEKQTFHDERRQRLRFGNNVCWKKQVQVQSSQQHELHCTDWGSCIPAARRGHSHSWQKKPLEAMTDLANGRHPLARKAQVGQSWKWIFAWTYDLLAYSTEHPGLHLKLKKTRPRVDQDKVHTRRSCFVNFCFWVFYSKSSKRQSDDGQMDSRNHNVYRFSVFILCSTGS